MAGAIVPPAPPSVLTDPAGAQVRDGELWVAGPGRPDVLAYPPPTTSFSLVLILALLTAGLYAGNWVYNSLKPDAWFDAVRACPSANSSISGCVVSAERHLAWWCLGGAGVTAGIAVLIVAVRPYWTVRRRALQTLDPSMTGVRERVAELANEAQVRRPPRLLLATAAQRDAFTMGVVPSTVVLPPAVAVRYQQRALFDPVLRHELAHVRNRDVALSWLAASSLVALVPMLLVALVANLLSGDSSLLPSLAWRLAALGALVLLTSRGLLRSREFDADLRAAQAPDGLSSIAHLLARSKARPAGRWPGVARALARHPSPAERLAVLAHPAAHAEVGLLDALAPAVLAGMSWSLLESVLADWLAGPHIGSSIGLASAVTGTVLGSSVGLGLWRASCVRRVVPGRVSVAVPALGAGVGLLVGQAASLSAAGGSARDSLDPALVIAALGAAGATVVSAGLGELWAAVSVRLPSPRASWTVAIAVNSTLFGLVLWVCSQVRLIVGEHGWDAVLSFVFQSLQLAPYQLTLGALGLFTVTCALVPRPAGAVAGWMTETAVPPAPLVAPVRTPLAVLVSGVLGGLAALGVMLGRRAALGPTHSDLELIQRTYFNCWMYALSAALLAIGWAVLRRRGAGPGLAAAAVSLLITSAGTVVYSASQGGPFSPAAFWTAVQPAASLGFVLLVVASPLGLMRLPMGPALRPGLRLAAVVPAVGAICLAAIPAASVLSPRAVADPSLDPVGRPLAAVSYARFATAVITSHDDVVRVVAGIVSSTDATPAQLSLRVQTEVLPRAQALQAQVQGFTPAPALAALHAHALDGARTMRAEYVALVFFLRTGDQAQETLAAADQRLQVQQWNQWSDGVALLPAGP